ncbi:uncharacterized protein LOC124192714 [Daphnia pulex]|uniref:uncharacterized protein LOC124192714 n=1 Tax=Daphnia pulex TaxID=6669 RepID=UPI001EE0D650|nr:uncharacterized protein LOC124192714 [Daphnia pulex]
MTAVPSRFSVLGTESSTDDEEERAAITASKEKKGAAAQKLKLPVAKLSKKKGPKVREEQGPKELIHDPQAQEGIVGKDETQLNEKNLEIENLKLQIDKLQGDLRNSNAEVFYYRGAYIRELKEKANMLAGIDKKAKIQNKLTAETVKKRHDTE